MKKKRIILSVINNLEMDQRVNKVASTLQNNGFEVLVVGSQNKKCHFFRKPYQTKRLPVFFKKSFLFYSEYSIRLFFFLLFSRCDILVANDTDTVVPSFLVSKLRRKKLVIDLHELFPEVPEVVNRKFVKKIWTGIESLFFPHIKYGYTASQSIAGYYKEKYDFKLEVIRNIPTQKKLPENPGKLNFGNKKIILYQGAVNTGRGIEWIIDAMPFVDNAVFVIIGKGDMYEELLQKTKEKGLTDRVIFKGIIPFEELPYYTCCADLGVCLLEKQGLSYYFSLPNRIFDFMHAGVPMLATDFPEIANIVLTYNTGKLINHYEPEYLAGVINEMLAESKDTFSCKSAAEIFCWENEEKKLLDIYFSL
jgi:glycosyltransferase involved in cell wall biosynthesis